ncbi:MAG: hypothetical protein HKN43_08870 [Rhodothermales bacterium]|nr:hypothetical protein [Rhodothermales bacterium]
MNSGRRHILAMAISMVLVIQAATNSYGQAEDSTDGLTEVSLSADRFVGMSGTTEPIRRLIGNVRLIQDKTTLRSALATQWVDSDRILFEGQVLVVDEGDTLRADSVLYFRKTKIGNASGRVVLNDDEVRVLSTSTIYDVDEKHSTFDKGVTLIDSTSTLNGDGGEYFSDEKRAEFYGNVVFEDSSTTILSDSVTYLRDEESASARGSVLITVIDAADDSLATPDIFRIAGPAAFSDRSNNSNRISGRATAMRVEPDSAGVYTDTLLVNADLIYAVRSDARDSLQGSGNVVIWSGDVAALADSMQILSQDSTADELVLTGAPIVWLDDSQLTADTIKVYIIEGDVDSVFATGNVFLARPDSVSGQVQQVRGRTLSGAITDSGRDVFVVGPNAEAIHFVSRDDELQGAVRASADRIVFYVEDDEPVRISIISGVEGLYYQAEDIPVGMSLSGFLWQPQRRPTKEIVVEEWPPHMTQSIEQDTQ